MNPKISIIIPVYKAEAVLSRCLQTIISQKYTKWECILVDDGSPDNSGKICDEYSSADNRFIVIHKVNGGVSSARNCGLEKANGEWVMFVDSDDWLEGDLLSCTEDIEQESDLVIFDTITQKQGKQLRYHYSPVILKGEDFNKRLMYYYENSHPALLSPWAKLFKREVINKNNIRFDERIKFAEDRLFNFDFLSYSQCVQVIGVGNYVYDFPDFKGSFISKYHITQDMVIALRDRLKTIAKRMNKVSRINIIYSEWWSLFERVNIECGICDENKNREYYKNDDFLATISSIILTSRKKRIIPYIYAYICCKIFKKSRNGKFLRSILGN